MRYFRAYPEVYEQVRLALDSAWGYPNSETKTDTAIPPSAELQSDAQGRVYLAISAEYCGYILPSEMLPGMLASGSVEEVGAAEYEALSPTTESSETG